MIRGISLAITIVVVRLILKQSIQTTRNALPLRNAPETRYSIARPPAAIYWPAWRNLNGWL